MKKYTTRPIDFTGCHPVIAEHLKRGKEIECEVWDYNKDESPPSRKFVTRYRAERPCPYETFDQVYRAAEPIPIKTKRIMPPGRAFPTLIAEGFAVTNTGCLIGPGYMLVPSMYALMGEDLDGEASRFTWPPCIIEEVEDDE